MHAVWALVLSAWAVISPFEAPGSTPTPDWAGDRFAVAGLSTLEPVNACRVFDSRTTPAASGEPVTVDVAGVCGVSGPVAGVWVAAAAHSSSLLSVVSVPRPDGSLLPIVHTPAGATRSGSAPAMADADGLVTFVMHGDAGFSVDVLGVFRPAPQLFASAGRVVATRDAAAIPAAGTSGLVRMVFARPDFDVSAVFVEVSALSFSDGFIAPTDATTTAATGVSPLVFSAGQETSQLLLVPVTSAGAVSLWVSAEARITARPVAWVTGSAAPSSPSGLWVPGPGRIADTRPADPVHPGGTLELHAYPRPGVLVASVTTVNAPEAGPVRVGAARSLEAPSTMVADKTNPVTATMLVAQSRDGYAVSSAGGTDVVVDAHGVFVTSWRPGTEAAPANQAPTPQVSADCHTLPASATADGLRVSSPNAFTTVVSSPAPGPRGPIVVIADSIGVSSAPETVAALVAAGFGPVCMDSVGSRTVSGGNAERPNGLSALARIRSTDPLWSAPHVRWVVQLGTNDSGSAAGNAERARSYIDKMLAGIGPTTQQVVWMDVYTLVGARGRNDQVWNDTLAGAPVKIASWSYPASQHPEWFAPDGIHLRASGDAGRAAAVVAALG